jgi:hypothetical protein
MELLGQRRGQQRPIRHPASMIRRPERKQSIKQKRQASNRENMAEL